MVLVDVQARAFQALPGHARDLAQAVVVRGLNAQALLDLAARLLGPGLRAEKAEAQAQSSLVDAHLVEGVGQVQGVARGADQGRGPVVLHDGDLAPSVAAGAGDDRRADELGAGMDAEGAGEQAVVEGDLHGVVLGHAAGREDARGQLGPAAHVARGVPHHRGSARGAHGGLHAHHVAQGHGEEPVRIVLAQVGLGGEGQALHICQGLHVVGVDAQLREAPPVQRHVAGHAVQCGLQPLQLQEFQVAAVHAFIFALPVHLSPPVDNALASVRRLSEKVRVQGARKKQGRSVSRHT